MKRLIIILLLVFSTQVLCSQEPYFISIDKSKGLPSNIVYDIFQDSKGFIWISHNEGLSRYDGYEFKNYENEGQTSRAGSYISEDVYGRIWYENFDGFLYYVERDTMKAFMSPNPIGFIQYGFIGNKLIMLNSAELGVYNIKDLKRFTGVKIYSNSFSSALVSEKNYIIMSDFILKVDTNGRIDTIRHPQSFKNKYPGDAIETHDKLTVYFRNNNYQYCYKVSRQGYNPVFKLPFNELVQNDAYTDSCYWFCTSKGVYAYNNRGYSINNNEPFFKSKSISDVLRDREGNYWFCTTNEGILFVPDINLRQLFLPFTGHKLARKGNLLYVGTKKGNVVEVNLEKPANKTLYNNYSNKEVIFLTYDSLEDKLLFSADQFLVMDLKSNKIVKQSNIAIKDCYRISHKYFAHAASGTSGIFPVNNTIDKEWDEVAGKDTMLKGHVYSVGFIGGRGKSVVYNHHNSTIYYAANTGLFARCGEKLFEIKYRQKSFYVSKLQHGHHNRVFALATNGRVSEITSDNKVIEPGFVEWLSQTRIRHMKLIWPYLFMLSDKAIFYNDLRDYRSKLKLLDVASKGEDISDIELWNNRVYLATANGIIVTAFKDTVPGLVKSMFNINSFKVNGKLRRVEQNIPLRHFENNVEINYSILNFKNNRDVDLYYRINDEPWQITPADSRTIRLAALSPGDYHVEFGLGQPGAVQPEGNPLYFTIHQPWWRTIWAIALFLALTLVVFVGIYKWQTGILRKQNQLLQQKFNLEIDLRKSVLKSIKAQMNPHFFYNALNTIQNFIFMDDKRNASTYLSKFSKLTRMILEMSEKETVSMAEELEALKLYLDLEKVRFSEDFNFTIRVQDTINSEIIKIPSMLIQPYVENAIKHGLLHKKGNKILTIDFKVDVNLLMVTVEDNGIGRARSAEINRIRNTKHQSFATEANSRRLDILNKGEGKIGVEFNDKTDQLGNSEGTLVTIRIPLL